MAQISGSDIAVGLYHEDAWGVTNGTPAGQVAYVESLGVSANQNLVESAVISGGSLPDDDWLSFIPALLLLMSLSKIEAVNIPPPFQT